MHNIYRYTVHLEASKSHPFHYTTDINVIFFLSVCLAICFFFCPVLYLNKNTSQKIPYKINKQYTVY